MSESIVSDITCTRCNTHLTSSPGNVMEKCPSCGAFLVWENTGGDADQIDLGLALQVDSNFDTDSAQAIKRILTECRDPEHLIPSVSRFALQLIPMLQDPGIDLVKLSNHIEKDQALVGNILKVANSAYYQGRGTIARINEALVRLGIKQTQAVVLATISRQMHLIKNDTFGMVGDRLWYHAVATSFACRELAQMSESVDPEEAYAAGLLHDIGRAVVLRATNELFLSKQITLEGNAAKKVIPIMDFLHVSMGYRLLSQWELPEVLVDPAQWHHSNDYPDENVELIRIVKAMDHLSTLAGFGSSEKSSSGLTEETISEKFGVNLDALREIRELLQ